MSRLLFTCRPMFGHYEPLRPLATAARDAGHMVAFATGAPADRWAGHDGFEAFPAGPDEDFRQEWGPRFPGWDRLVGDEQRRFFFTEIFANLELVLRAVDLGHVLDQWEPDLVVHEMAELAAPHHPRPPLCRCGLRPPDPGRLASGRRHRRRPALAGPGPATRVGLDRVRTPGASRVRSGWRRQVRRSSWWRRRRTPRAPGVRRHRQGRALLEIAQLLFAQ